VTLLTTSQESLSPGNPRRQQNSPLLKKQRRHQRRKNPVIALQCHRQNNLVLAAVMMLGNPAAAVSQWKTKFAFLELSASKSTSTTRMP